MSAQAASDSSGMVPPTTERVTSSMSPAISSMNDRRAGYAASPNSGRHSRRYSSGPDALRLIEMASRAPASSGQTSLPFTRHPRPLVSRRTLAPVFRCTHAAISRRSSSLSVGSPYPQKTISSASEALRRISSSTSAAVGSEESHRLSASPSVLTRFLTQKVHLQGHLFVMLTYHDDP